MLAVIELALMDKLLYVDSDFGNKLYSSLQLKGNQLHTYYAWLFLQMVDFYYH